jgi:hypothetical protein
MRRQLRRAQVLSFMRGLPRCVVGIVEQLQTGLQHAGRLGVGSATRRLFDSAGEIGD